jgi:hypothetical protein
MAMTQRNINTLQDFRDDFEAIRRHVLGNSRGGTQTSDDFGTITSFVKNRSLAV